MNDPMPFGDLPLGILLLIWLGFLALGLIIQVVVCWLLMNCFAAIPKEHRKMEPARVWLLLIPLFNLVWNFFVYAQLADSYRSYFDSKPEQQVTGDCGKQLGMIFSGCAAASAIPCVSCITGPAAPVILVVLLVKANELRAKVVASS
jgi:hypothetical protein